MRTLAQNVDSHPFEALLEVLQAGSFEAVVSLGDEFVNVGLMLGYERLNVGVVYICSSLRSRHQEV